METSSCAMPGDHLPPSAASATSGSSWADSPKGAVTKGTGVKPQAGPGKVDAIWGTSGVDLLKPAGLNATIPAWAAGRAGPGCPRRSCSPMQPRAHKAPHVQWGHGTQKAWCWHYEVAGWPTSLCLPCADQPFTCKDALQKGCPPCRVSGDLGPGLPGTRRMRIATLPLPWKYVCICSLSC